MALILPGQRSTRATGRTRGGLIVPKAIADEDAPYWRCRICGLHEHTEREYRAFQAHVIRCAADNEGELHERSLRTRAAGETMHGDENWEADREEWTRKHREELLEGRKTLYGKDDPWRGRG